MQSEAEEYIAILEESTESPRLVTYEFYPRTIRHQRRVAFLADVIGENLGISEGHLFCNVIAARFHDVAKREWPEFMEYRTRACFQGDEELTIRRHSSESADIMAEALGKIFDFPKAIIPEVCCIIRHHHENYSPDANEYGYPGALAGEDIPLGSRIIRVADCYDAMRSPRPHRSPEKQLMPHGEAVGELQKKRGLETSPEMLDAFLKVDEKILGALYLNVTRMPHPKRYALGADSE